MDKHFAFTGTREGLSLRQLDELEQVFAALLERGFTIMHNGAAIGADEEAGLLAKQYGFKLHVHPCNVRSQQSPAILLKADRLYHEREPIPRNKDMVNLSELTVVCPAGMTEIKRGSGTWATWRYTKQVKKEIIFIAP